MQNATNILLQQLRNDISRQDGDAAVRTIHMIRVIAGPEFADLLINELLNIGLRRVADHGTRD